jgi:ATP-dependent Clp protease ATP-binding subunit ClpX
MSDEFHCSFCGKRHDEAFHMLAGPACYICDECVDSCARIVARERAEACQTRKHEVELRLVVSNDKLLIEKP